MLKERKVEIKYVLATNGESAHSVFCKYMSDLREAGKSADVVVTPIQIENVEGSSTTYEIKIIE